MEVNVTSTVYLYIFRITIGIISKKRKTLAVKELREKLSWLLVKLFFHREKNKKKFLETLIRKHNSFHIPIVYPQLLLQLQLVQGFPKRNMLCQQ